MKKIVSFDSFAYVCPHFTSNFDVNNGYGCTHPEQEETREGDRGEELGCCLCRSCPLGIQPDMEDLDDEDVDWGTIERGDCVDEDGRFIPDEYLMVEIGVEATSEQRTALEAYEQYMARHMP